MNRPNDNLAEFEKTRTETSKIGSLIPRLDFIFLFYIFVLLFFKYFIFKEPLSNDTVYQVLFIIAMPLFFWVLYIKGYKTGWFLRLLYYSILVIIISVNLFAQKLNSWIQIHLFIIVILSLVIVVTSFLRKTLDKLKIGSILISTYTIIALLLLVSSIYFLLLKK